MMPFAEKLSFLMHITQTSNKELAAELGVDPSLVSLLRTGKRRPSKKAGQARGMAEYFARRCPAAFQRQALSEMLGQASISPTMPAEALADALAHWLQGEDGQLAEAILSGIGSLPVQAERAAEAAPASAAAPESQTRFFYGEAGRREVMALMLQQMLEMDAPGQVLTVVDDNLEWLLSDYPLMRRIQSGFLQLLDRGFVFHQIMPPLNYINRYAESLQFWLPIYATGQAKVYYYPRLRGNLYRHSIIVVPGRCVQYACSVALGSTSDVTLFSTDPQLVAAYEKQFHEHVALCHPSLNVHRDPADFLPCLQDFTTRRGDTVQMASMLSPNSMPQELLEYCVREDDRARLLLALPRFEERLREGAYIDMCRIASAEQVRAGVVPMIADIGGAPARLRHTPETYCMHLRNILRLMDQHDNYFFLPLAQKDWPNYDLFVCEGGMALVLRTDMPFLLLEIRREPMVTALREHLLRKAENTGYDGMHREKIRMTLRALIQELGG
ncbi:MAG: hypothetical protein ACI4XW_04910 [Candidatus Spyradocola sp.]